MFNWFKDCSGCKEHEDLKELRRLTEERAELVKQRKEIFKKQDVFSENNSMTYHWESTEKFGRLCEELAGKRICGETYEVLDKLVGSEFGTNYMFLRSLNEYLDGYFEYKDKVKQLDFQIKIKDDLIKSIKKGLGIE